jgi:F0F1-type ATP synthase membrane subunit b/b'
VRLRAALEAGARARSEAESLRMQLEADVRNLPELRQRLRADLLATAEFGREALLAAGREGAHRIREDARLLAEQEIMAARQALRDDVVDEVVREATALLRTEIRDDDQQRFVREFVSRTGALR